MKTQTKMLISGLMSLLIIFNCSITAYAASGTVKTPSVSNSLSTQAKQCKKYTDFPEVIDFGALTNTAVYQINYSYGNNRFITNNQFIAEYIYPTAKISSSSVSKYTGLLTASGYTDNLDVASSQEKQLNVYHHIFTKDQGETGVIITYGQSKSLQLNDIDVMKISIFMPLDKCPKTLKSVTASKGAHEPARYAQQRPVPDFGAYTGAQLIRIANAGTEYLDGTAYVYDVKSFTNKDIEKYISLCKKMNYDIGKSDSITINMFSNDYIHNPYSITITKAEDGLAIIVFKTNIFD